MFIFSPLNLINSPLIIMENKYKDREKNLPTPGNISLCGVIVEADLKTCLAKKIESFIYGGELKNSQ